MESVMPREERVTVSMAEAADMWGVSVDTVKLYKKKGLITTVQFGRRVLVSMEEVRRIAREGVRATA